MDKTRKIFKKEIFRPPWMWINEEKKIIYFENPKVCSSSIKTLFGVYEKPNNVWKFSTDKKYIKNNNYFKFGFCRNPITRLCSGYNMKIAMGLKEVNFEDFINGIVKGKFKDDHWTKQIEFLPESLDYVGRFEIFNESWNYVKEKYNLPEDIPIIRHGSSYNYKNFFKNCEYLYNVIYEYYIDDFNRFGYKRDNKIMNKDKSWLDVVKLQTPELVYFNGEVRPWKDAVLHVSSEGVNRGLNVFEGMKGYKQKDGNIRLLAFKNHFYRLQNSSKLLHIPCPDYDEFKNACHSLIREINPKDDVYFKTVLYVTEGHWGLNTKSDLVITAYNQNREQDLTPKRLGVSSWQRSSDISLPYRIKTGTNYQVARLAQIEGRSRGYPDMILLNQYGRVAEASTACIIMIRNGDIITPPSYEGTLESITIDIIEKICKSEGINFIRRPIDRTELYISDGVCLCGTLAELTPIDKIDEYDIPNSDIIDNIRNLFFDFARYGNEKIDIDFSIVSIN